MPEHIMQMTNMGIDEMGMEELQRMLETLQDSLESESFTDEERAQVEAKIEEIKTRLNELTDKVAQSAREAANLPAK